VEGGEAAPATIVVTSDEAVVAAARATRARATAPAAEGRCEDAERAWLDARNHRPLDEAFAAELDGGVHAELAACWVARADAAPEEAIAALVRARSHDFDAPGLAERVEALADARWAEGLELRERRRWVPAGRAFEEVVTLDPYRPWARRYAEEAREKRLVRGERARERGGAKAKAAKGR
jgi:hypothetical protein